MLLSILASGDELIIAHGIKGKVAQAALSFCFGHSLEQDLWFSHWTETFIIILG